MLRGTTLVRPPGIRSGPWLAIYAGWRRLLMGQPSHNHGSKASSTPVCTGSQQPPALW